MNDLILMKKQSYDGNELDSLIIANKFVKNQDWEKISNFVTNNPTIRSLEFSGTNLNELGLTNLGEILKKHSHIRELKLEWNNFYEITSEFDYFCECTIQSGIQIISLNNNRLGINHVHSICKLIKHSQNIYYIDLRWNEFSDDSSRNIIEVLKKNTTLQTLNLIGNKINHQGLLNEIQDMLERNKQFQTNLATSSKSDFQKKGHSYVEGRPLGITTNNFNKDMQISILEKERDVAEEFKARYDVQLICNSKLEKKIKELEILLNNEKQAVQEFKNECENEINKERNLRKKLESVIVELRDQLSKVEVSYQRRIASIELNSEKKDLEIGNLKKELEVTRQAQERTRLTFQEKYDFLNNEFQANSERAKESVIYYQQEYENAKLSFNETVNFQTSNYLTKLKNSEEAYSIIKSQYESLLKETSELKRELQDLQVTKLIELAEREKSVSEMLNTRHNAEMKSAFNKISILTTSKDDLTEKLTSLNKQMNDLRKKHADDINYLEESELKGSANEKLQLNKQYLLLQDKLTDAEMTLKEKDTQIMKLKAENLDKSRMISSLKKEYDMKYDQTQLKAETSMKELSDKLVMLNAKYEESSRGNEALKLKITRIEQNDIRFMEELKKKIREDLSTSYHN